MLSKRPRTFLRSFRFKIAATYFTLVVVSSVVLFGFLYYMIAQTLKEKDARIIESEYKRFSLIALNEGVPGFERWFQQKQNRDESSDVFVRLIDKDGKTLYEHDPGILRELNVSEFKRQIDLAAVNQLSRVESADDREDAVEYFTGQLAGDQKLQVGKDTDDREDLLEKFRAGFGITLTVALVTAVLTGLFFSRSILRPIQNLIVAINNVRKGELGARAQVRNSGDEVDELAVFLNAMLNQNSKLIGALTESLDAVAHDIRTPLTRLRATAERALQIPQPNSIQSEALGEIMESTDQVIDLLNAIFDMSEANAGALKLNIQKFSVRRLLEEVLDVYSLVADEKSIEISLDVPVDFDLYCDIRVKQVVANLLDNALKFAPLKSKVKIRAVHDERRVLLTVEDEGPGISDDEQKKIWERLYRGDQSRSTRGMGLGLSLVRAIVVAHGGTASVGRIDDSRPAPGSRFEILLPHLRS